jgi:hypothetical protein
MIKRERRRVFRGEIVEREKRKKERFRRKNIIKREGE